MKYKSTRDSSISLNSKYAIAKGISEEGGFMYLAVFQNILMRIWIK